jgi:surface polysaccharide O-acyltransferase-like enzyme
MKYHCFSTKAIKSFKNLLYSTIPLDNETELMNIITKIASNEWYTHRITAIYLFPCILQQISNENRIIITNFLINFSKDENILIKKEISSNLKV